MTTLGVIADSHIPDRMRDLPEAVFTELAGVDAILHAGDVSTQRVLDALAVIAPVYAVGGNRDFFLKLPLDRVLTFDGVSLGLTHGHGGWWGYLREKLLYYTGGFYLSRHLHQVRSRFAGVPVQAIVFGHSHYPVNVVADGVLMFNPGSLGPNYHADFGPAVGRLHIAEGKVRGEIVPLDRKTDWLDPHQSDRAPGGTMKVRGRKGEE